MNNISLIALRVYVVSFSYHCLVICCSCCTFCCSVTALCYPLIVYRPFLFCNHNCYVLVVWETYLFHCSCFFFFFTTFRESFNTEDFIWEHNVLVKCVSDCCNIDDSGIWRTKMAFVDDDPQALLQLTGVVRTHSRSVSHRTEWCAFYATWCPLLYYTTEEEGVLIYLAALDSFSYPSCLCKACISRYVYFECLLWNVSKINSKIYNTSRISLKMSQSWKQAVFWHQSSIYIYIYIYLYIYIYIYQLR